MSGSDPGSAAPHPPRFLSPAALLARLRPPAFAAQAGLLEEFRRLARAVTLAHRLAGPVGPAADWPTILLTLLKQAETQDWFEVDWLRIESAQTIWLAGEDLPLAVALDFIPLQLYGLELIEMSHPPLALLQLILAPQFLTTPRRREILAYLTLSPAWAGGFAPLDQTRPAASLAAAPPD